MAWTGSPSCSASVSVLSFGYWCTNFLVVQRAMAAKNIPPPAHAARGRRAENVLPVPGHRARHIAIALCSMPDKSYRIPPPILAPAVYANAIEAVKSANPADSAAAR